jgi:hypothetical protein
MRFSSFVDFKSPVSRGRNASSDALVQSAARNKRLLKLGFVIVLEGDSCSLLVGMVVQILTGYQHNEGVR